MYLRPKITASTKSRKGATVPAVADTLYDPCDSRGWQTVASPDGSMTRWRRRGRIARPHHGQATTS